MHRITFINIPQNDPPNKIIDVDYEDITEEQEENTNKEE